MGAFVEFENVSKIYKTGDVEVHALTDASFEIQKGEFCVIVGESGAGKTTLFNLITGAYVKTETDRHGRAFHGTFTNLCKRDL